MKYLTNKFQVAYDAQNPDETFARAYAVETDQTSP